MCAVTRLHTARRCFCPQDKIEEEDKETISSAIKEAQEWLDENPEAGASMGRQGGSQI